MRTACKNPRLAASVSPSVLTNSTLPTDCGYRRMQQGLLGFWFWMCQDCCHHDYQSLHVSLAQKNALSTLHLAHNPFGLNSTTSRPASTQSPNSNIGILSQWKQKSAFFSKTSFMQNMDFTKFSWGDANTAIVQGVPASSWAAGIEPDSDSAVQVMYPAGSRNPSAKPVGGFGFYSDPRKCCGELAIGRV